MTMYKTPLFKDVFFVIFFIAALFHLDQVLYLTWTLPLFDVFMHFMGGFWISITTLWFFFSVGYNGPFKHTRGSMVAAALLMVLFIGSAWEVFEYMLGLTTISYADKVDTIQDLCMDIVGALTGYLYFYKRTKGLTTINEKKA
jgi:hypothetical protein